MGVCVRSGRSLCVSPDWSREGASVVLDRNSGDYWVLDGTALQLVKRIADRDVRLDAQHGGIAVDREAVLLQSLCDVGILERTQS